MTIDGQGTLGALLGRCLRAVGVPRVFGSGLSGITGIPGLGHLRVDEPDLAVLLADAHGRVSAGRQPGAALLPGRRLHIGSQPGAEPVTISVTDPAGLVEAVAGFALGSVFATVELELDVDLDAPAPAGLEPLSLAPAGRLLSLSPSLADLRLVTVAGPGVVRAGKVEALRTFASRTGIGVLETFGAVGLLPRDDERHHGTIGLQQRDRTLAGLDDAQVVVAVGVDPTELVVDGSARYQVLDIEPFQLDALAQGWSQPGHARPRPPLVDTLDAVLEPLAAAKQAPLSPARAAAELADVRPPGGLVVADPGPAGLWVLRALPAAGAGSIVVPARFLRGFAVAAAVIAALDHRPVVAVTTAPLDPVSRALLDLATRVGSRFVLVEWGADVDWADAGAHQVALRSALEAPGIAHVPVPVDLTETRALVEAAGPVTAWQRGLPDGSG